MYSYHYNNIPILFTHNSGGQVQLGPMLYLHVFVCLTVALTTAGGKPGASLTPVTGAQSIKLLRQQYMLPPSTAPYNLQEPDNINPSMGQAQAIDYLLKEKVGIGGGGRRVVPTKPCNIMRQNASTNYNHGWVNSPLVLIRLYVSSGI